MLSGNVFGIHMDDSCQNMAAVVLLKMVCTTKEMTFSECKGSFLCLEELQLCLRGIERHILDH